MLTIALLLLAGLGVLLLLLVLFQRSLVFPVGLIPAGALDPDAVERAGGERLWLAGADGPVEAWWLPGRGAAAGAPRPAVIFAHGNGELIDLWPAALEPYRAWGIGVLLVEYRGYGRSAGKPSEAAITADFIAARDLLAARPEVDAARIVYHGRSLGAGAVCALAAQRPPRALVLEAAFTSVAALAWQLYKVPRALVLDPFDNLAVIADLDAPVLLLHGERDRIVPLEHSHALRRAARDARLFTFPVGHDDPPDRNAYWSAVRAFLEETDIVRGGE